MSGIIEICKSKISSIYNIIKNKSRIRHSLFLYRRSSRKAESENLLKELRDKHAGKRAFIICNGPSLKAEDLTKIHGNGDISIASNKIDKIFPFTPWRPTYYCVADESYQYSLLDVMNQVPAEVKFFRTNSFITTRKVTSPTVWLNTNGDRKLLEDPKFSERIDNIIYAIASVTYMLIQIMVYMGVRELYIIGCDNSYAIERKKDGTIVNNGGASYFAGSDAKDTTKNIGASWEMNMAYEYAAKYAKENGIKIFNATRGGHLEAFPRVDFDSLF